MHRLVNKDFDSIKTHGTTVGKNLTSVKFRGTLCNGIFFNMRFFLFCLHHHGLPTKIAVTPTNRADLHTATSLSI